MSFKFDETKDFNSNLQAFLDHMEGEDAKLGAILRSKVGELTKLADESTRRTARTEFSESIKKALKELIPPAAKRE